MNGKKLFVFLLFFFTAQYIKGQADSLIFSEVMFYPSSANSEFIEIFNFSKKQVIELTGYSFRYESTTADKIIPAENDSLLYPGKFAVIFEGDYDFSAGIYSNAISDEALLMKIDNNAFGSSGMANTSGRTVRILNQVGDTVISYLYSADNSAGISDEKIILNEFDDESNWSNSLAVNGTPGYPNSVTPLENDLKIETLTSLPEKPLTGEGYIISAEVKNAGQKISGNSVLKLFDDKNLNGITEQDEFVEQITVPAIQPGNFVSADFSEIVSGNSDTVSYICLLEYDADENTANNRAELSLIIFETAPEPGNIIFNEIMYQPSTDEPEWIELYNRGSKSVSLNLWGISDPGSNAFFIDFTNIPAGGYLIVSDNADIKNFYEIPCEVVVMNLPSLNNTGDKLFIKDADGNVVETLEYTGNSKNAGKSLERIDAGAENTADNWSVCMSSSRATPGRQNSITKKNFDTEILSVSTNPEFPLTGDQPEISVKIKNNGKNSITSILTSWNDPENDSIPDQQINTSPDLILQPDEIYEHKFRFNKLLGESEEFLIIRLDAESDEFTENNIRYFKISPSVPPGSIVINEFMYQPKDEMPEWIELFNNSNSEINLKSWLICDAVSSVKIKSGLKIPSGGYFVLSDKNNLSDFYRIDFDTLTINLPSLNNSGDQVVLKDSLGRTIDSLEYFGSSKEAGISVERIDPEQNEFSTCQSKEKATPGKINSVSRKKYDAGIGAVIINPDHPFKGETVEISVIWENKGTDKIGCQMTVWNDNEKDSIPDNRLAVSESKILAALETYEYNFREKLEDNAIHLIFRLDAETDEYMDNNTAYLTICPADSDKAVVINEFMYYPKGEEPEWIELFNRSRKTVNLKSWKICDAVSDKKIIENVTVDPDSFIIISGDENIKDFYRISSKVLVTDFPSLNNSGDQIILKDSLDTVIDSIEYFGSSGDAGISLERISTEDNEFSACISYKKATPGKINSVSKKEFDAAIVSVNTIPENPLAGSEFAISGEIKNNGKREIKCILSLWEDTDRDSTADKNLVTGPEKMLKPDSSYNYEFTEKLQMQSRTRNFIVRAFTENDQFDENNEELLVVNPGYEFNSIIVNEIMYNPLTGNSEWIELLNRSGYPINIAGWFLGDNSSSVKINLQDSVIIYPGDYLTLFSDSSGFILHSRCSSKSIFCKFPSLNNEADAVVIKDEKLRVIDSVNYENSIQKGFSLERILPEGESLDLWNWYPSFNFNGSTAGCINSADRLNPTGKSGVAINEILFEADNSVSEFIELFNISEQPVELASLELFVNGIKIKRISDRSFLLEPGEYFVVAADSGIYSLIEPDSIASIRSFSLNNTSGNISISDYSGNLVDTVAYEASFHNSLITVTKNKSLEKISVLTDGLQADNWTTSVSETGSTPGKRNSVFINSQGTGTGISVMPNPFSPDNDGFEDFTKIDFNLEPNVSFIRARVFDSKGRVVRTIAESKPVASSGTIIFDGYDNRNTPLRVGIYILLFEAFDQNRSSVSVFKKAVVVARKF